MPSVPRPKSNTAFPFAPPRRPRVARHQRGASLWGLLLSMVTLALVGAVLVGALYGMHLDRTVRAKFEDQRLAQWALPARVFARPLELYAGQRLTSTVLLGELERLKYREAPGLDRPGSYARNGERVRLRTQGFRFWDGAEPEKRLELTFADGHLVGLHDLDRGGDEIALVRLEPALIASIYPIHNEDRVLLTREELSELLVSTLLAVEDRNFYQHHGVDLRGILRAAYRNLRAGRTVEGASTITQQLVKNFYLTQQRTWERKLTEAYMAVLLDRRYTKDEILTAYANEVYMGQDGSRAIHGFGLASQFYFARDLDELGIPETALLIAILKGPSEFNPRRHPQRATERRNLVIDTMIANRIIAMPDGEQAKQSPLGLRDGGAQPAGVYPAFVQLMRRQLQRDYREEDLRSEGLQIFTTLDPLVQTAAEQAVRERLPQLERDRRFSEGTLEAAAVVTSVAQGEVLALVGGRDATFQGFNRALDALRSIGSLIKPAIYLAALERPERYSVVSSIPDRPVSLRVGNQLWQPKNFDGRTHGNVPLYVALAKSYNLAAVNLGLELGVPEVADTLRRLGIVRRVQRVPALLLGSVSLTPIEVAQMYQTIAAGGFRAPLRAIREVLDLSGQPLSRYPLAVEPAVKPEAAFLTQWALRKVVEEGTATWLKQRLPDGLRVAGKTGTTNELRDSWFAGFSADRVAVVWVGRDDNQPARLTGGAGALRVWGDLMANIDTATLDDFTPYGVVMAAACGRSAQVPFNSDHPGVGASCGQRTRRPAADGSESEPERETAVAAAPVPAPPPSGETERRQRPQRPVNQFMRDFYGN